MVVNVSSLRTSAKLAVTAIFAASCGMLGSATARADVGENVKSAVAAAAARPIWSGITAHADTQTATTPELTTRFERAHEPEERRYEIVAARGRSVRESFEAASRQPGFSIETGQNGDFADAVSQAALADFRSSKVAAVVTNEKLRVVQRFFAGARFSYVTSRSIDAVRGVRTFTWTEIPRTELAERIRASRACANSGECGE